ncbi:MAG: phage portal protein [Microbacteriaceae bacterium]
MADQWPPAPFDIAHERFKEWDAWWAGDTDTLNQIYKGGKRPTHTRNGQAYKGGIAGALSKMWWGQPIAPEENRMMVHLPVAADICQLSADLLFAEAPKIEFPQPEEADKNKKVDGKPWVHPGQARLDMIMGSDLSHAEFLKSGEYAAALGGTFLAVVWDKDLKDHVWVKSYAADAAIPRFKYGVLTSVQLWTEYRVNRNVYRLLESHSPGMISFELYEGGEKNLGTQVPLSSISETTHYEFMRTEADWKIIEENPELMSHTVTVATGTQRLTVVYYPNIMPQRTWRKTGELAYLGRSDLDGIEETLDKIDQVYSSLMRDVDNGQGRIIVPESYLDLNGVGKGAVFDMNRQVYSPINMLGQSDTPMEPKNVQFAIRVEEHKQTIEMLKREIASATGYSPLHLGVKGESGTKTATEVTADYSDSERTRDKKAIYVKPALAQLALAALAVDGVVFPGQGGGEYDELPSVEFPSLSQADMEKLARTINSLYMSESISLRERVSMAHPDWSSDQIDDEVAAIQLEFGKSIDPAVGSETVWPPEEQAGAE